MPTAASSKSRARSGTGPPATLWRKLDRQRLAHLATADAQGRPLVVPLCFACGRGAIYSVVDEKRKSVAAARLRRLRNIAASPRAALLVDHYEEDWLRLWYILAEGRASVLWSGREHAAALRLLAKKYPQYRGMQLEHRPVIKIVPRRVIHWRAG
jgi:PPOX class probable F420-dependent enzyme